MSEFIEQVDDLVPKLQRHAVELYSARGFNSAAHSMLVAADEIVKLRAAVAAEREACAKVCDARLALAIQHGSEDIARVMALAADEIVKLREYAVGLEAAAAIRERGEQ